MLHLRRALCLLLLMLLLVQPVYGTAEPATESAPIVAMYPVEEIPADLSGINSPGWLRELTSVPLYSMTDGNGWQGILASGLPTDVTSGYAGTFGIPEDAVRGYAFRISLNPAACRADGTPITADDCIDSFLTLLENENTSENWLLLANAREITEKKPQPDDEIVSLQDAGFSTVHDAWEAGYQDFFVDITHFWGLPGGWYSVSDRTRIHDDAMPGGLNEYFISPAYLYHNYLLNGAAGDRAKREFIGISRNPGEALTMEDLGVVKLNERELVLITEKPVTVSTLLLHLEHFVLMIDQSCGPYRVNSASDSALLLDQNPNWWGESAQPYDYIYCHKIGT